MKYVLLIRKETIIKLFLVVILLSGVTYWLNSNLIKQTLPTVNTPQSMPNGEYQDTEFQKYILESGVTSELKK